MTREPTRSEQTYKADDKNDARQLHFKHKRWNSNVLLLLYVIAALPRKQWLNCSELNENVYFFVNSE